MENKCSKIVYGSERFASFNGHNCAKKATVERGGKSYCTIHDPEKIALKDKERRERWEKQWAESAKKNNFDAEAIAKYERVKQLNEELVEALDKVSSKITDPALRSIQHCGELGAYFNAKEIEQLRAVLAKAKGE